MSQFYGTLQGQAKTEATRRGGKSSGIRTRAASWNGVITVHVYESDGKEYFTVDMGSWHGKGDSCRLISGLIGDAREVHYHALDVKAERGKREMEQDASL